MAPGFLLEAGHGDAHRVTKWVEGAPERSFWTGLKLGERQVLPVLTYRCAHCGYLEFLRARDGRLRAVRRLGFMMSARR